MDVTGLVDIHTYIESQQQIVNDEDVHCSTPQPNHNCFTSDPNLSPINVTTPCGNSEISTVLMSPPVVTLANPGKAKLVVSQGEANITEAHVNSKLSKSSRATKPAPVKNSNVSIFSVLLSVMNRKCNCISL